MTILLEHSKGVSHLRLQNVLLAPNMYDSLISISQLINKDFKCIFFDNDLSIFNRNNDLLDKISKKNDLYCIYKEVYVLSTNNKSTKTTIDLFTLHKQLGHVNFDYLKCMICDNKLSNLNVINVQDDHECVAYNRAKVKHAPISNVRLNDDKVDDFEVKIHLDV